ncbi:hypothetical protein ACWEJ6_43180 [Nonomuraea sp. NPDC004702]
MDSPEFRSKFYSEDRFLGRFRNDVDMPGFELQTAHVGGILIGFIFGHRLPSDDYWWNHLVEPTARDMTNEQGGRRSLALIDFVIRRDMRRRRIGSRLHWKILEGRPEDRVVVCVGKNQVPAYPMYLRWSYQAMGRVQAYMGAPILDVLTRTLR